MIQLYSGPLSLFSAKVRIALTEKNLPYERIDVPFNNSTGYKPKHPEVTARNPKAQVPVLVDGDVSLYDSTIIIEYLEDRYPEPALFPRDPAAKALCRQREAAADEILFPHVLDLIREVFYKADPAARDAAKIDAARAAIQVLYVELDELLATRTHVCGEFSVADVAYFVTVMFATNLGAAPPESLKNLQTWLGRISARPSVTAEIEYILDAAQRVPAA